MLYPESKALSFPSVFPLIALKEVRFAFLLILEGSFKNTGLAHLQKQEVIVIFRYVFALCDQTNVTSYQSVNFQLVLASRQNECRRAIARNVSFTKSLRWPSYLINSVDKTKLSGKLLITELIWKEGSMFCVFWSVLKYNFVICSKMKNRAWNLSVEPLFDNIQIRH